MKKWEKERNTYEKSKVILKLIARMILLTIVGTAIFYTRSNMNMRISVNDSKEKYNSGIDLTTATAQQVVTDMKAGWNLGNTLDSATDPKDSTIYAPSYYETAWSNPVTTKAMIDEVKAKGFNTVRIPVTWGANIEKNTQYTGTISSAWLDRVEEVVNYALDNNMYCIVNVHHDVGKGDWPIIFATADSTSIQLRLEGTVLASRYGVNTDKGIFTPTKETPFVAVQDKGAYSIDGTVVKSYSDISPVLEPANTLKVGGIESRIYYLKVWDASGNLIGDFIPVLDSYGIACLYNKVTKEYCYSTGATKYYPTNEVSPESITLNKTEIRTEFKENIYSLVATLFPDNVNINDKITWTTSDDTIAQVFKGGDVVILGPKYGKAGECTITATTANGKTATCNVTVVMEAKVLQLQTKNYLKQV